MLEAPQPNAERAEPLINTHVAAEWGGREPLALGPEFLADLDKKIERTKADCQPSTLFGAGRREPEISLSQKYGPLVKEE